MIKIKTNKTIGYTISDIGPGGKEYNIKSVGVSKDELRREIKEDRAHRKRMYGSSNIFR